MDHSLQAAQLFLQGYNCAQAITVAFSDVTGLDKTFSANQGRDLQVKMKRGMLYPLCEVRKSQGPPTNRSCRFCDKRSSSPKVKDSTTRHQDKRAVNQQSIKVQQSHWQI